VRVWRYSRWDGSQERFELDADRALDALSELLMEGLDVDEALEWMRRAGFELGGMDFRVMGVEELLDELRERARELFDRFHLEQSTRELAQRLEALLDREERARRAAHGLESEALNDFLARRHGDHGTLSEAIEAFRDYDFEDAEAAEEFRELLAELDRLRALERFRQRHGSRFRGAEAADYETAQRLREQIEGLEQMARDLAAGRFEAISPEQLQEWLSAEGARSLILLRGLEDRLQQEGYLRSGPEGSQLTPRAIRRIGAQARGVSWLPSGPERR